MLTVWKTVLKPEDEQDVELPKGAEILCAREQSDAICIWYRCDPDARKQKRKIAICGTGHPAPGHGRFLGSASLHGGRLMFHVFEL